jgi:uncharacterized damage-inducible protein DinB
MIPPDKEIKEIFETLRDIYSGDPWHGPNIKSVAESIQENRLYDRISSGHSLIEILNHVIAWRNFVIRRLKGEPENGRIEIDNWKVIQQDDKPELKMIIKKLDESQEELLRLLESIKDSDLSGIVEGKTYTLRKMLNGLIHHDLYHLGQISLLKK